MESQVVLQAKTYAKLFSIESHPRPEIFLAEAFIDYARVHREALSHNKRLWKYCDRGRNSDCFEPELLNRFCSLFPFQTMKTVRLRVNLTRALLEDDRQVVVVDLNMRAGLGKILSKCI